MQNNFDQFVVEINASPLSTDVLHKITLFLKQQTDESLSSFVTQFFQSLLILEKWAWQLLSQNSHQWINETYYQELFHTLASFNKRLIFNIHNTDVSTKASLLFSVSIDQINSIFQQTERTNDDNDPFTTIVSLWLDNHSYFLYENQQYDRTSVTNHMAQYIVEKYVMNDRYKLYLTQLRQPDLTHSIFTAKMLFYIKTCSFHTYAYLFSKFYGFPYTADKIMDYLCKDYLQIIHVHSYTVASWDEQLLSCIAQLVGLICGCCWWDGKQRTQMKILLPTEQITCDHVQDLVRIIAHTPFYKQTKSVRSNDETILMDATLVFLIITVQTQNINWLFRSNASIRDTIISVAESALNNEVSLCGYGILGEVLTDDQLKYLKIADNISSYFLTVIEEVCNDSSNMCKQTSIPYILRGRSRLPSQKPMCICYLSK